jgi:hypothetical protein
MWQDTADSRVQAGQILRQFPFFRVTQLARMDTITVK